MPRTRQSARLPPLLIASLFCLSPVSGDEPLHLDKGKKEAIASAMMQSTWNTRQGVRSFNLKIPPPRGQIVDRNGLPLALNRICHYLALQLPGDGKLADAEVLAFAQKRVAHTNKIVGQRCTFDGERLLTHYRNRRWMPFPFSPPLKDFQLRWMEPKLLPGLILHPTYCRIYPQGKTAAHMIGYSGRKASMPTGVPVSGEPLFPYSEGREGLEASFEEYLQGEAGELHRLFNERGELVMEEMSKRPVPGGTVVTTLDLGMQKLAESTLARYCRRGALVVLDVRSGDVLAMASRPGYDPNVFLPYIGEKDFAKLRDDPSKPLFPRAFAGAYPPASTFKVVTALAALDSGVVNGDTRINGPGGLKIGNRWFRNWHSGHEGKIDVERALARSCNTWFYRVGMDTGAENFCSMAQRLGFGRPTGLPLAGEVGGLLPTEGWMREKFGHGFADGYLANAAIGQGEVLTTPLQVAQMMAAVANRSSVLQLRLVSHIQDLDGHVVKEYPVVAKNALKISARNLNLVTTGLTQVVHSSYGTGKGAANGYQRVAGKTGTGQWGATDKKQYVAWFAGFVPADNPRFAFAALYEGRPGEYLSGGKKAAPIVSDYFGDIFRGTAERSNAAETAKYIGVPSGAETVVAKAAAESQVARVETPRRVAAAPRALPVTTPTAPRKERSVPSRIFGSRRR